MRIAYRHCDYCTDTQLWLSGRCQVNRTVPYRALLASWCVRPSTHPHSAPSTCSIRIDYLVRIYIARYDTRGRAVNEWSNHWYHLIPLPPSSYWSGPTHPREWKLCYTLDTSGLHLIHTIWCPHPHLGHPEVISPCHIPAWRAKHSRSHSFVGDPQTSLT